MGTRMSHFTERIPKALIPVAGEPFIRRQLRLLKNGGVTDVLLSTGHLGSLLEEEIAAHRPHGLNVRCETDGDSLLGTAGALRRASDQGLLNDQFMVVYGDSFLLVDYQKVWASFDSLRHSALMTVFNNAERLDTSNATYANGLVTRYHKGVAGPADAEMDYVDYGLSVFSQAALRDLVPPNCEWDLATVFEALSSHALLQGYEVFDRFFEIGSPRGLADLENLIAGENHDAWL